MTWYLQINGLQSGPIDMGLDGPGRVQCGFNIIALKRPSTTFVQELVKVLTDAGVGTFGTTIFGGSQSLIPDGNGPFVSIIASGGPAALLTHNEQTVNSYPRLTAQIVARARDYVVAEAKAWAAFNALMAVKNVDIVP